MRKEEVRKDLAPWHSEGVYGIGADPVAPVVRAEDAGSGDADPDSLSVARIHEDGVGAEPAGAGEPVGLRLVVVQSTHRLPGLARSSVRKSPASETAAYTTSPAARSVQI